MNFKIVLSERRQTHTKKEYILYESLYINLQKMQTNSVTEIRPVAVYLEGASGWKRRLPKGRKKHFEDGHIL